MNYNFLNVLLLVCILHIFLDSITVFLQLLEPLKELRNVLPFSDLSTEHSEVIEDTTVENSEDYIEFQPRYDVDAFKLRMSKLRDEDGLSDVEVVPHPSDFTGTEVVTENFEIELDKLRR